MAFLKEFFQYVPHEPPNLPKNESPDPNSGRALPSSVRSARRNLMIANGVSAAWAAAQFAFKENDFKVASLSLDMKDASIPLVLIVLILYLTFRWGFEFALMTRNLRRWPLARLDFKVVLTVSRFALLLVAAGAVHRSLGTIFGAVGALGLLVLAFFINALSLLLLTIPVRISARIRAGRDGVIWAVEEGIIWAGFFSFILTASGFLVVGVLSFLDLFPWGAILGVPIDDGGVLFFAFVLVFLFASHWLLKPVVKAILADKSGWYSDHDEDGSLFFYPFFEEKESLL